MSSRPSPEPPSSTPAPEQDIAALHDCLVPHPDCPVCTAEEIEDANDPVLHEALRKGLEYDGPLRQLGVKQPELVMWQWRMKGSDIWHDCGKNEADFQAQGPATESRALFTHPTEPGELTDEDMRLAYQQGKHDAHDELAASKIARTALGEKP